MPPLHLQMCAFVTLYERNCTQNQIEELRVVIIRKYFNYKFRISLCCKVIEQQLVGWWWIDDRWYPESSTVLYEYWADHGTESLDTGRGINKVEHSYAERSSEARVQLLLLHIRVRVLVIMSVRWEKNWGAQWKSPKISVGGKHSVRMYSSITFEKFWQVYNKFAQKFKNSPQFWKKI